MNQIQLIQQISELLPTVWDTVSSTVSNNTPAAARFESPIAMRATPQDLASELGGTMLVIQFAMATHPDATQVIILRSEVVLEIARIVTGMLWDEVDEDVVSEVRPFAEAIIQGICLGLGNALVETVVATGMSVRNQSFQLPDNLALSPSIIRTQVAINLGDHTGVVLWLMDDDSARFIAGAEEDEEPISIPGIPTMDASDGRTPSALGPGSGYADSAMDVLLDVPLEISVELGRARMVVRDVLDLGTGSIVEVDKAAGEPVDVMVNGRLVAKGEVVVIEDNFGVRITEILNPAERFRLEAA
jgi:flagellar motor switch protein FliN